MITESLGITPTKVSYKRIPRPKWSPWTVKIEADAAEYINFFELADQLVSSLEHKADDIGKVVRENKLDAVLGVAVWISMDDSNPTPGIGFEKRVIDFVYKTGAFIDVDTYRNDDMKQN